MKRKRFSVEQIVAVLKQAEAGAKLSRRISVTRSASAEGDRPSFSSRARTKESMGLADQFRLLTFGKGGRFGGT